LVSLLAYVILFYLGLSVLASQVGSHAVGITFAFFVNKIFVFQAKSWQAKTLVREMVAFTTGRIGVLVGETVLLVALVDWAGLPNLPCKLATTALVVVVNYVISKKTVFKG